MAESISMELAGMELRLSRSHVFRARVLDHFFLLLSTDVNDINGFMATL